MSKIPLKGALLLASPILNGPIFDHSVVCLSRYSQDKGAMGLVLNRPLHKTIEEIGGESAIPQELRDIDVFVGGPVDIKQLAFAAFYEENKALKVGTHISADQASEFLDSKRAIVHAYVGHASWEPGQLEDELDNGLWIVTRPNLSLLKWSHQGTLWQKTLREMSPMHAILSYAPHKPFFN